VGAGRSENIEKHPHGNFIHLLLNLIQCKKLLRSCLLLPDVPFSPGKAEQARQA